LQYTIQIKKSAQKKIAEIPEPYLSSIEKAILKLENNPRPNGCKKLIAFKSAYRIRVGVYRIVYEIHDKVLTIFIFDVDHRKQVYK
jgi:mRNA interferase RelE/StbE